MKRLLGVFLVFILLQPFGAVALSPSPAPAPAARTKCRHGCGSYACNRRNCGEKCNDGPSCRGCWKSCEESRVAVNLTPAALRFTEAPVTATQKDNGNPDVKVWVNTASGVYHCPGTRWYGATKQGEYMTQAEAQKKGYRPAYGRVCR